MSTNTESEAKIRKGYWKRNKKPTYKNNTVLCYKYIGRREKHRRRKTRELGY